MVHAGPRELGVIRRVDFLAPDLQGIEPFAIGGFDRYRCRGLGRAIAARGPDRRLRRLSQGLASEEDRRQSRQQTSPDLPHAASAPLQVSKLEWRQADKLSLRTHCLVLVR